MMKHQLKRYDAYKDSEFSWLNKIPKHWHMERVKNLTRTQSGTTPQSGTSEYYENGTNSWVRTTDLNNNRLNSSEYKITDLALKNCGLKSIPVNSVLLAMYGGMGTIGKNSILIENVTINQSVCAVLPHEKRFDSTYFWYYVQYFRPHWEMFADSARKDPNINQEVIKRLWVANPPLSEQKAIANYLDTKTAQIDGKIDLLTQKAIQYGKLKQSLINETVTRGLDKTVAMKDSGVEWLGEVPEHWEVKRLKEDVSLFHGYSFSEQDFVENISRKFLVKITELQGNKVLLRENSAMLKDNTAFEKYRIKKNETLIALSGATAGKISIFDLEEKCYLNQRVAKILTSKNYNYKFLFYFMNRQQVVDVMYVLSNITAQPNFNNNILFINCLTPPLPEQQAIANYLDVKTTHIDRIVETINTQIDKLKELRKTLINDIVTGKIKVVV